MKIAIIGSRGYPYVYSGYETFVKELAERLVERGVEVHVYCHKNLFTSFPKEVKGIQLHYIPTIETKSLSQLIHSFFSLLHASLGPAKVLLVVNAANGPLGWIPKLTGKKTLINVDGLEWLRPKWKGLGAKYFYFAANIATKLYDKIITDAEEMRKVYLQEFNSDSTVIAYGAPARNAGDYPLPERFELTKDGYYLIVGRLIPDNNADLIIKGFLQSDSKKTLVIVGDVPYKDQYADEVKKAEGKRVKFLGYVTDSAELMALYRNCFAYLHGHKFGGTNPTMLKAMSADCAILALNTPFNKEMLNNGEYGIFFNEDPASVQATIEKAEAEHQTILALRSTVARGLTKKYDWDNITDQYLSVMKSLIEK